MVTRRKPPRIVISPTEHESVKARLLVAEAQRSLLFHALRRVLEVRPKEWTPMDAQDAYREALAVMEEVSGR